MDLVTQIVLGGAVGYSTLGKKVGRKAALWGGVAGLIPDLDVIHAAFTDALGRIEFHRTYSHSLLFIVLLAPIMGYLLSKKYPEGGNGWFTLTFLSLITHPILDFFTTYGTEFFYPFNRTRIAWHTISVVDPLYTLPLLIGLIIAVIKKKSRWNTIGIILSTTYLLFTPINQMMIKSDFQRALNHQKINYTQLHVAPTLLNNILWVGVAETETQYYVGYKSHFDTVPITFHKIDKNHHLLKKIPKGRAISLLTHFTNGLFALKQSGDDIIFNDMRYGFIVPGDHTGGFTFSFLLTSKGDKIVVSRHLLKQNYKRGINRFFNRIIGKIEK